MFEEYNTVLRLSRQDEFPALEKKMSDPDVMKAVKKYIASYTLELNAIEAHDHFELCPLTNDMAILQNHWAKVSKLQIKCTKTRRIRKRAWRELIDLLEEEWQYTSTDEEDE